MISVKMELSAVSVIMEMYYRLSQWFPIFGVSPLCLSRFSPTFSAIFPLFRAAPDAGLDDGAVLNVTFEPCAYHVQGAGREEAGYKSYHSEGDSHRK